MSDRDAEHTLNELQEARAEIDRLREFVRWRKYPDEKPEFFNHYLVLTSLDILGSFVGIYKHDIKWTEFDKPVLYWRPIGPLPGEGGE